MTLGREIAPLVLTLRRMPVRRTECSPGLVQYPHDTQKPPNCGYCDQAGVYRHLSAVELIVLGQSCLAMV